LQFPIFLAGNLTSQNCRKVKDDYGEKFQKKKIGIARMTMEKIKQVFQKVDFPIMIPTFPLVL
jgi:hypothetical protein